MSTATELVTPDNVSIEVVRDIYEAAFMEVALDEERKVLTIREEILARVHLSDSKDRLQLYAGYGIKEDAQRIDRLELVNRINDKYALVRAAIDDDGDLYFDYTVLLKGGVTKKAIVQATRVFLMLVPKAVNECDEDGIVD
jgi:hypothetical protein